MTHSSLCLESNSVQGRDSINAGWGHAYSAIFHLGHKKSAEPTLSIMEPLIHGKGKHLQAAVNIGCCLLSSAKAGTSVVAA